MWSTDPSDLESHPVKEQIRCFMLDPSTAVALPPDGVFQEVQAVTEGDHLVTCRHNTPVWRLIRVGPNTDRPG